MILGELENTEEDEGAEKEEEEASETRTLDGGG